MMNKLVPPEEMKALIAEIDTLGATLKGLQLLKHKDSVDPNKNFVLFGPEHQYEAQSGLTGESGPNHRTLWRAQAREYALEDGKVVSGVGGQYNFVAQAFALADARSIIMLRATRAAKRRTTFVAS